MIHKNSSQQKVIYVIILMLTDHNGLLSGCIASMVDSLKQWIIKTYEWEDSSPLSYCIASHKQATHEHFNNQLIIVSKCVDLPTL